MRHGWGTESGVFGATLACDVRFGWGRGAVFFGLTLGWYVRHGWGGEWCSTTIIIPLKNDRCRAEGWCLESPNGALHNSPGCNPGERGSQSLAFCRNAAYPEMPRPHWRLCGVPSERTDSMGSYPGLHPGLVCAAPLGQVGAVFWLSPGLVCAARLGRRVVFLAQPWLVTCGSVGAGGCGLEAVYEVWIADAGSL